MAETRDLQKKKAAKSSRNRNSMQYYFHALKCLKYWQTDEEKWEEVSGLLLFNFIGSLSND